MATTIWCSSKGGCSTHENKKGRPSSISVVSSSQVRGPSVRKRASNPHLLNSGYPCWSQEVTGRRAPSLSQQLLGVGIVPGAPVALLGGNAAIACSHCRMRPPPRNSMAISAQAAQQEEYPSWARGVTGSGLGKTLRCPPAVMPCCMSCDPACVVWLTSTSPEQHDASKPASTNAEITIEGLTLI